jgi:hypothetical protein
LVSVPRTTLRKLIQRTGGLATIAESDAGDDDDDDDDDGNDYTKQDLGLESRFEKNFRTQGRYPGITGCGAGKIQQNGPEKQNAFEDCSQQKETSTSQ